ncbi:unnamed protein product [Durusdinium trenchii]|uniref:Uncharacterized protein n=1 Tax=Durusdinium trenchii TaxID=1381693 RepID=A0ABP0QLT3_9DINO
MRAGQMAAGSGTPCGETSPTQDLTPVIMKQTHLGSRCAKQAKHRQHCFSKADYDVVHLTSYVKPTFQTGSPVQLPCRAVYTPHSTSAPGDPLPPCSTWVHAAVICGARMKWYLLRYG